MRKDRAEGAMGARVAAGAATSAIDRMVPTAGMATVTAVRMAARMMSSWTVVRRAAAGSEGSKQWAMRCRCPTVTTAMTSARVMPAQATSAGETVITEPVRKELTARGRGLNQVARK